VARQLQNWIDSFLQLTDETESPKRFRMWSAIAAISTTLKRSVWIDRGRYKLYPHQYIILTGPPAVGKGEAIDAFKAIVKLADTGNIIKDRVTPERVIERLEKGFPCTTIIQPSASVIGQAASSSGGTGVFTSAQTNIPSLHIGGVTASQAPQTFAMGLEYAATVVVPELPVYLNASPWSCEFMCEMWDRNEWEYDTKHKGTFKLKDLCVGLLGGCVPDFIRKLSGTDSTAAVSGGFTSRCVFVFEAKKEKKIAFPKINGQASLEIKLAEDLKYIKQALRGEFVFDNPARLLWERYYDSMKINEFESDVIKGFKGRLMAHIFKTAMCLSAASSDNLVITEPILIHSIALISRVRDELDVCFRGVGESALVVKQDRIMAYLENKGMCSYKEILKDNMRNVTDDELTKIMYSLELVGFVTRQDIGRKVVYRQNPSMKVRP
jgi:hypothetical protein